MNENPILVERYRGPVLESFHRGVICLVDQDGEILFSAGNVQQMCYPRSALKLFQVIPLFESGAVKAFGFTPKEIALMCGSHNGEKEHVEVVEGILSKIGLNRKALQCGAQYPTLTEDRNTFIKEDIHPGDIHNNCSGKHAGFLAYCVHNGLDTDSYLSTEHPLQKAIKKVTAEMNEYPEEKLQTGLDGCSAPIFALPVYNQAVGYKNLIHPDKFSNVRQDACRVIIEAITQYPYMLAGKGRYCTEMMEVCGSKVIGKTGADGVYSLGFKSEGWGCCIKIDDGLMGPQYTVAQELISALKLFPENVLKPLEHYIKSPQVNWAKKETGITCVNTEIFAGLYDKVHGLSV
jgi:L-asparaginase II